MIGTSFARDRFSFEQLRVYVLLDLSLGLFLVDGRDGEIISTDLRRIVDDLHSLLRQVSRPSLLNDLQSIARCSQAIAHSTSDIIDECGFTFDQEFDSLLRQLDFFFQLVESLCLDVVVVCGEVRVNALSYLVVEVDELR